MFQADFFLSEEVTIQKRVVHDVFAMFGEVGGLYDFMIILCSFVFNSVTNDFFLASMIANLFRVRGSKSQPSVPFQMTSGFIIAHSCSLSKFSRKKYK